jgi:ankyrin repeat protein
MTHHLVLEILNCVRPRIQEYSNELLVEAQVVISMIQASKVGNVEFLDAIGKANPNLLWIKDEDGRGIFEHAILNRRKAVFQLIHNPTFNGQKKIIIGSADEFGNTLLHLAASSGPSSYHRKSGPAVQMQEEILWFKVYI